MQLADYWAVKREADAWNDGVSSLRRVPELAPVGTSGRLGSRCAPAAFGYAGLTSTNQMPPIRGLVFATLDRIQLLPAFARTTPFTTAISTSPSIARTLRRRGPALGNSNRTRLCCSPCALQTRACRRRPVATAASRRAPPHPPRRDTALPSAVPQRRQGLLSAALPASPRTPSLPPTSLHPHLPAHTEPRPPSSSLPAAWEARADRDRFLRLP
ncbi:hypothetical protein BU26DRAFT_301381 [Trematosphaeria pertusa]|uniref:Uncharacterized protein n=1 Tax=Trematosphaeria pertusa TaxID=390896 RepID=A0A6A6IIK8_9PLEO|nr:uncharacterized protein BU26DRAFT_301381 [Trematosphaeria pertusa]KAF2250414.1 hypothetical protein BU26DRAFT_301381 [Trematosphaeria pertusa]